MNLKIVLVITIFITIGCTPCIDARSKTRRRHKTHHHSSNKHISSNHHSESLQHTVESDRHPAQGNSQIQPLHETNIRNTASHNTDNTQDNRHPVTNANTNHPGTHSVESGGNAIGSSGVKRRNRHRRTTVAPTTTTKIPCSNDVPVPSNTQQQPSAGCDIPNTTIDTQPQATNKNDMVDENL